MKNSVTNSTLKVSILLLIFLMPLIPKNVYAQAIKEIAGTVYDAGTNEPLNGVTVHIKGENAGTLTDSKGRYNIKAKGSNVIIFSFIGYVDQEETVGGRTEINVKLKMNSTQLNEVVAIGYATQSRATVTGSIASVQGREIQRSPAINLASSLQGLLPGTMALQSTGEPGRDGPSVFVRGRSTTGNSTPLVVVDGIQNPPGWQYINSNDIASISVLKDASAAIYGARAANGVILITTKRGSIGKPVISYSFNQGFTRPTILPKIASSEEFAGYVNQLSEQNGQGALFSPEQIKKLPNYNWYGAVLKSFSTQSQHNLNIRGGNENVKYSVSGSFSNQESIFKKGSTDFKTYAIRTNLDANINKYIKVGLDMNAGLNDGNYPAYGTTAVFQALLQVPWIPPFYSNGLPSAGIEQGQNPAVMVTSATGNTNNQDKLFIGKASFEITIPWVNGLSIDGFFSYTDDNLLVKNWQTPWTVYNYDSTTNKYIPHSGGTIRLPQLTQSYNNTTDKLTNLRVNYKAIFNNNSINVFVGGEQEMINSSNFYAFRRDFISPVLPELFAGSLNNQQASGSELENSRQSLFGRLSYGYKEKYLVDFDMRYDGSSNFPKGKRFGLFPGVSAAWIISQEKFMENLNFIDNLKFRASYGEIGNDLIAPFQYLTLYTLSKGYNFGNPMALSQGLVAGVTPNPNITWEVEKVANVGLDATLWNGLLGFSLDFFKQRRSNILTTRSLAVPVFTGLSLPSENIGVVDNKGMEFQLSSTKSIGKFSYQVGANISYNRSKVINLSEPSNIPKWQNLQGHLLGARAYYQAIGIFRTQDQVQKNPVYPGTVVGDLQYKDVDGNGKIDANDMVVEDKTNIPRLTFGLNFLLTYKDFSLWANFAGFGDVWQYYHLNVRNAINGLAYEINNRYTSGSMNSKYPILPTINASPDGSSPEVDGLLSNFWLMNTSYVRLKTLEFGYNLPEHFLSKFKINTMRVYINGNDLLTFSKLKLFDPSNTNLSGFYYPLLSVYNIGLIITFH